MNLGRPIGVKRDETVQERGYGPYFVTDPIWEHPVIKIYDLIDWRVAELSELECL